LLIIFSVCNSVHAQTQKLVFSPHWLPQAQFAGYYVAEEMGFYKEAGIEVEIIHPSASVNAMHFLQSGQADIISLFLVTGLDNRFKGVDLVNIAQFSHNSALMFVAKKTSNINTLKDFKGKKVGIWRSGFEEIPKALIHEHQLEVNWVPILSTVNLFLLGGIDVMTVMWYNEYNQIYLSGLNEDELSTFFLSDYGYNIPEDGMYVLQNTLNEKNDALKAFVEASIKGWQYAAKNRDFTLDVVIERMRQANIPSNKAHQKWMLEKVLELQEPIGQTNLEKPDFDQVHAILKGQYPQSPDIIFEDFFRPIR
ncbi:MAG TPA: ABC transporter substrate-binding protein, partial [Bacteroidales bacterium]|nr:ABC transporter substrate-binding protein [Bacteroidales bacterium]